MESSTLANAPVISEADFRRVQRRSTLAAVLALTLAAAFFYEAFLQPPQAVVARAVLLKDQHGATRAALMIHEGKPALFFYGADAVPTAAIGESADGPSVVLYDGNAVRRIRMVVGVDGPVLGFRDETGVTTHELP